MAEVINVEVAGRKPAASGGGGGGGKICVGLVVGVLLTCAVSIPSGWAVFRSGALDDLLGCGAGGVTTTTSYVTEVLATGLLSPRGIDRFQKLCPL